MIRHHHSVFKNHNNLHSCSFRVLSYITGEQKKVGAEQSDIRNDKDLKLIGEIRVETRLKSGLNYCVGPDDDADGVLVLGPCEEQRRWPHSRPISIERRPEGFGFTLRNVVAYPSHIHKVVTFRPFCYSGLQFRN